MLIFQKLWNVIKFFPQMNQNFVRQGITFTLLYSSRDIKWRTKYLHELQTYVDQIDTRIYHDFTIDKDFSRHTVFLQEEMK